MNPALRLRPLALLAALSSAAAGLWSIIAWGAGQWQVLALGPNYIPMAPATAVLFLVLGLVLAAQRQWPESRTADFACLAGAGLTLAVSGLALLQSWLGFALPWDGWLAGPPASVGDIPVGRMSPVTALTFLLTTGALLGQLPRWSARRAVSVTVSVANGAALAVAGLVALSYTTTTPLFYTGGTVPMALLTALAFLALNGSLLLSGLLNRLLQKWQAHDAAPHVPVENRVFTRRLLLAGGITGGLIIVAGIFYLRREQAETRLTIYQQLNAIARLKAKEITTWRQERLGEARFLQRTPAIISDIATLVAAPGDPAARTRVTGWLDPIKGGDRYAAISLLDTQARPLLSIPAAAPAEGLPPALLGTVLDSEEPSFTDMQWDAGDSVPHIDLLVPIRPRSAPGAPALPPIAVIVMHVNPRLVLFPLIQDWPMPNLTAESMLVRREGDEVVYLSELRHRPGEAGLLRRSIHDPFLTAAMAARGTLGVSTGLDYRGVAVLASARPIPGTSWILITKIDQAEAYAQIVRDAWQTGLALLLLLVTMILSGTSLWRWRHADFLRNALAVERERKVLTERLGLVMHYANDIILIFDEHMRIVEASDQAKSVYGRTAAELLQLSAWDLRAPGHAVTAQAEFTRVLQSQGLVFETVHRRADGSEFPVEVSSRPVTFDGRRHVLSIIRDITERRRLAEEMAWKETQFRAVFDHAPVGMSLTSGGRLRLVNAEHARITGVPVEQSAEPGIFARASHPEDYARQTKLAEKFIRGEIDHYTVEKRYLHPDGRVQWAELTSRFFPGPVTGDQWIVTTVTDIAERKAREQEIERLNRMYFVISQVNQTIARAKSRAELFPEICRVLVEFGRFRIAWVGWLDRASQLILPVGVAGDEHGYVTGIVISTDPNRPESHGPSGTAFREGRIHVCNDFFGDPALQPWHERARPCGFQSSIALPLREDGAVRGLLTVYAAEKHFFGPQEITLLEEAADDLSFALGVLAGQDRRQAAEAALQQAKEDFSRVFMSSPTAVCITTQATGLFLDLNEAWARLGGYRREDAIGRTTLELNVWSEAQDRDEIRRQFAAEHRVFNREIRFRRKDGTMLDTLISIEGISFAGEPCLISTIIDITREKQAQEKLNEQIAELRRWHEATLGREDRILDLKREVNELLARAGAPARYSSATPKEGAGDA